MAVGFFNPAALLAALSGWEYVNDNVDNSDERFSELGGDGDEGAYAIANRKNGGTVTLKCFAAEGNLTLPDLGSILGGYHVDSFSIKLDPKGWPTMDIQVHKHLDAAHPACRTYTPTLVIACGRGIVAPGGFALAGVGTGFSSFDYSCSVSHIDETDGEGDFLAGDSYDGVENVSIGTIGLDNIVAIDGWDRVGDTNSRVNNGSEKSTFSFTKHIDHNA